MTRKLLTLLFLSVCFVTYGQSTTRLRLPFFDNFSYNTASSFSQNWKDSTGVAIVPRVGAPSPNVILFDGLNRAGFSYSDSLTFRVESDSLLSHPFSFVGVDATVPVKLSFFWQGNGSRGKPRPELGDSLVLYLKRNNEWVSVWSSGSTIDSTIFTRVELILDPTYKNEDFQLKFLRYGPSLENTSIWLVANISLSPTLALPFWEDFSSDSYKSRFKANTGVYFNSALANNPPSTTVVSFDGIDNAGNPYGETPLRIGQADSLVSVSINLDSNSISPADSLYFSFFWEKAGRGEQPDKTEGDSLVLKLYDKNGVWRSVWQAPDSLKTSQTQFYRATLKITNPVFFHPEFKFKFLNYGRLSGSFDLFHVDYIVIDTIRNSANNEQRYMLNDTLFLSDYAISNKPSTPTTPYFSIPSFHLGDSILTMRESISYSVFNLSGSGQGGTSNYRFILQDDNSQYTVFPTQENVFQTLIPKGDTAVTQKIDPITIANGSKKLITQVFMDSTGSIEGNYQFLQNDTVTLVQPFEDYYSYDDGSYERTWQNQQRNAAHALEYRTKVGDTLTHIDISFPHDAYNLEGNPFSVFVWANNNGKPGDTLSFRRATLIYSTTSQDRRNPFTRYDIPPVYVEGTYFIGVIQAYGVTRALRIGIDLNNNSMDKYWYFNDEDPNWTQFGTDTAFGAVMMRPVFRGGTLSTTRAVSARRDTSTYKAPYVSAIPKLSIFPNPSEDGILNFNAVYDRVDVADITGKIVFTSYATNRIELKDQKPGIYFVITYYQQKRQVARFIYQH